MARDKLYEPRIIGLVLTGGRKAVEHVHLTADLQVSDIACPSSTEEDVGRA